MIHMIDDLMIIAQNKQDCAQHLALFQALCKDIGIPLAPEKTTSPDTITTFLGITLDSSWSLAQLPSDKLSDYSCSLQSYLAGNKLTRK